MQYQEKNTYVNIKAHQLSVWTPEVKSWWRKKPTKPQVNILKDVSVSIQTGEFVAVIGPSGAGKTTFLSCLAGKCTLASSGKVTINGTDVKDVQRGVVEIVPQSDVFIDSLCVLEHLIFMTEMKLGSVKKRANRRMLHILMEELKLKKLKNSRISSLSGGERRLLSLASSLLSNPQIVVCDEPTTGLDSYNAYLVIGVLKKLSAAGKIVICTLHQPSSDLFNEFDSICLMSEGKLIFHGTHDDCRSAFESINLKCPKNFNAAEFYIKAVSTEINLNKRNIETSENNSQVIDNRTGLETPIPPQQIRIFRRNWFKQVNLLLWRSFIPFKRDIKNYLMELFICTLLSAMIIGTCYIGISGTTQRGIQDFRGFLWLMCSEVSFILSYNALYAFESDLTLFKKEAGIYSTSAFYVSRFITMMPRCIIWPFTYVIIATLAVQLPNRLLTTMKFVGALIPTAIASTSYGLGMGAMFITTGVMADIMPCVDLPLFIMSGAFLRISSLPLWLYPIKYVSHFFYGMDAISNIYWRQIDYIDCPVNSTSCLSNGEAVLLEAGYSSDFVLEDLLGIILVTILWSVIAYCGLKREENKGYAY